MAFDIYQLDKVEPGSEEAELALEEYQDDLLEEFAASPEGQALLDDDPGMGFWAAQLIYYGYVYVGVSLPEMTVDNIAEIVTELFPRKISLSSPDDANRTIPELVAFWQYLKRAYELRQADAILEFLRQIEPEFSTIMNDPSNFGMAKSIFTMGRDAGFDMTNEEDANKFIMQYNASLLSQTPDKLPPPPVGGDFSDLLGSEQGSSSSRSVDRAKKKKRRKMAKASKKKNRRKK